MAVQEHLLSPEEYLAAERMAAERHEFLDGMIYSMPVSSAGHARITGNLGCILGNQLAGKRVDVFLVNMKLRVRRGTAELYYYPDVLVDCSGASDSSLYATEPSVIFEVLSPDTERTDRHEKLLYYQTIPSLKVYVIVDQFRVVMTVYRRTGEGWVSQILTAGDTLELDCIGCRIPVLEAYERTYLAGG